MNHPSRSSPKRCNNNTKVNTYLQHPENRLTVTTSSTNLSTCTPTKTTSLGRKRAKKKSSIEEPGSLAGAHKIIQESARADKSFRWRQPRKRDKERLAKSAGHYGSKLYRIGSSLKELDSLVASPKVASINSIRLISHSALFKLLGCSMSVLLLDGLRTWIKEEKEDAGLQRGEKDGRGGN